MERVDGHLVRADQPLAVGLLSTVHVHDGAVVDALGSGADLARWLRLHAAQLAAGPGAGDAVDAVRTLRPVVELRDALARLVRVRIDGAAPDPADVEHLNRLARRAPHHVELRWSPRGGPTAELVPSADATAALLAELAADGIALLAGEHGEVHACGAPSCVLVFVRGHARQAWCSPACGNRARVARHYRRTHPA